MSFCGQCGFQLAPNDTRCPRCGAVVEPELPSLPSEYSPDDATVESVRLTGKQSQYGTQQMSPSANQPKLVLGPGTYPPTAQGIDEATSMMSPQTYGTAPQVPGASYPGYAPQQAAYPGSGANYPGQYPPVARRKSPRTAGLVFIFLGLMLILGALVLFALQHNGIIGSSSQAQSSPPTSTAVVSTPIEQAQAVVRHYYTSVNAHDYTTAYHLWKNNTEKFADFQNGYRNTRHAGVTFGTAHMQSATVAYLPVNVTATELDAATQATKQSTYTGYYTVERQANGTWLILDGNLYIQTS